jgi:hypothetical protein
MHITASGIMGWGIASARLEKRYGRLAGAYLASVGIHGLWNGSVILTVFGSVQASLNSGGPSLLSVLTMLVGLGALLLLLPLMLILMPVINRLLRAASAVPAAPQAKTGNDV